MTLRNWLGNGWLTQHATSEQEIADLLDICRRDLRDCRTPGLSADWRLNIAYNAALQAATAALAAAGYRAARDSRHFRVIQSLAHTIGAEPGLVRRFDAFRKKRNAGGYETAGQVSDQEANEMAALAHDLRQRVERWIRDTHPGLIGLGG